MIAVTNEDTVGLPPLSETRKPTWDYYRIEFLEDGYPGRRTGDQLHPHPIYGAYVINDYLGQHRLSGDERFLDAARRVADAAIERMIEFQGSLIFQYQPNTGLSLMPYTFYSGLTQSRYLSSLSSLQTKLGDRRYAEPLSAILRSLRVPAEAGGVARRTPKGNLLIEEYSHSVPDYTLNGWATATLLVHEYAKAAKDDDAMALFEESVQGIAEVLPLYDIGELANSRYRLTGPTKIRLGFSDPDVTVISGGVNIPGQGFYPLGEDRGKWTNRFLSGVDETGRIIKDQALMEVLISRVTWPTPNVIRLEIEAGNDGHVRVEIGEGPYDPVRVQSPVNDYKLLEQVSLVSGHNVIEVPVRWADAELVAYPTSFTKLIGGRRYNSYHFIHIDTLNSLVKLTGNEMFRYYRDRWTAFPDRWPLIPAYADADIVLQRYQASSAPPPFERGPSGRAMTMRRMLGAGHQGFSTPATSAGRGRDGLAWRGPPPVRSGP